MNNYILRKIPATLWQRVKARAAQDGIPLRGVFLILLFLYAEGALDIQRFKRLWARGSKHNVAAPRSEQPPERHDG